MKITKSLRSPNAVQENISVEFAVIHYTACDLQQTLEIFMDPKREVAAHMVIDVNGDLYELIECLEGTCKRGSHAGLSKYTLNSQTLERLNFISLGIELVNLNGNLFPYTDAQYSALQELFTMLKAVYPTLQDPSRVVGHEHIAGFRGKADPGRCFDWPRFFKECYPTKPAPAHKAILSDKELVELTKKHLELRQQKLADQILWTTLSSWLETYVAKNRQLRQREI